MDFKKRSEMCKPEVKEQKAGTKFSGDIEGGAVFSGKPAGNLAPGVFYKVNDGSAGGFVRLAYGSGGPCTGYHFDECEIQGYKELNVTLVDEDA